MNGILLLTLIIGLPIIIGLLVILILDIIDKHFAKENKELQKKIDKQLNYIEKEIKKYKKLKMRWGK